MKTVIRTGKLSDAESILALDYSIFPEEWHVPKDFVERILARNEFIYRILEVDGIIKGHYCLFPFEKEIYDKVLSGEISEDDSIQYIVDYHSPKSVYLYAATIIVDIFDNNRSLYAHLLKDDFATFHSFLNEKEIEVLEIGSIAITRVGRMFCKKMGMEKVSEHKTGEVVYKIHPSELMN